MKKILLTSLLTAVWLYALRAQENGKASMGGPQEPAVYKPTPQLNVRVYSFAGLSHWLVQAAEIQAARPLHEAHLDLHWVDCTSPVEPAACYVDPAPTDLIVRVLAKALPQAGTNTLGIAGSRPGEAIAFIFYDRIVALRTQARSLHSIMGRVLAHEIVHVLLPEESHADFGLMRGLWSTDDLRTESYACMGLPAASVQLIQREVVRRVVSGRSLALK